MAGKPTVGVIALQGDFAMHAASLRRAGANTRLIRAPEDLAEIHALVIPGGESTTMTLLGYDNGLWPAVRDMGQTGMSMMATCAGIVMLARELVEETSKVTPLGLLDIAVSRNAYGSQVDSFEQSVMVRLRAEERAVPGVFIRAPVITQVADPTKAVGWLDGQAVMVRKGNILGLTFHPETTKDLSIQRFFIELIGISQ